MHAHVRLPLVLVQVAFGSQPPLLLEHSFTSVHVVPLPVNPVLHAQLRLPVEFVQVAFGSQPPLFVLHSSMSTQPLLIAAALIAIYIVLGVLYESLLHPLTIISTLPSAGLGKLRVQVLPPLGKMAEKWSLIRMVRALAAASKVARR